MAKRMFTSLLCPAEKITEEQLITDANLMALDRAVAALSRRRFFTGLAASGAGLMAAGMLGSATRAEAQAAAPTIPDVLNFALNLEFLEANLYAAVTGSTPPAAGMVIGAPGALGFLDAQTMATAVGLYNNEMEHIALLQSTITSLGGTPIAQPEIDLSMGGKVMITTQAQFLAVARQFTAVGNSAYAGGAQYLVANSAVLTAAAQILGTEAQHLGAVNYLCCLQGVISPAVDALDYPPAPNPVAPKTTPAISYFTVTPTSSAPGTGSALGPIRNTSQVLGIVYGASTSSTTLPNTGVIKGGFFPNGVNGAIVST